MEGNYLTAGELLSEYQRYAIESNSQLRVNSDGTLVCCCQSIKDTQLKAIHNPVVKVFYFGQVVVRVSKIRN